MEEKKDYKIFKNAIYNLFGWAFPVVISFITIPIIVNILGSDNYGILVLSGAIIGYFGILDINLTAGSIRYIAEYHAKGHEREVNEVFSFSFLVYIIIGIVGAILIFFSIDTVFLKILKIPPNLKDAARIVFYLAALGFLLNLIQSYLSSVPKSAHRFDIPAKIEMVFGIGLALLTVLILYMGSDIIGVSVLRIVILLMNAFLLYFVIKKLLPYLNFNFSITKETIRKITTFSGYAFLSRIASTISAYVDKLIIGSVIGSAAVTFYAVPFILVGRLINISHRLSMGLFPIASEMGSSGMLEDLRRIYKDLSRHIFFLNIAITSILCLFSKQILQLWMGEEFAQQTYIILIFIALAYFIDSLTHLPSLVNDGLSYPQITGGFALGRAVFSIIPMLIGAKFYSVVGVAVAYFISSLIFSTAFLIYVHKKTIGIPLKTLVNESFSQSFFFAMAVILIMFLLRAILPNSNMTFMGELFLVLIVFGFFGYKKILSEEIKKRLVGYINQKTLGYDREI
jgi:O-antigen/teichoic acid export membrane protein